MNFSQTRKSRAPVINVTSLIDVLFLLVIFVLVTAKYDTEGGIAVDLPKGKARQVPRTTQVFGITIMHDGTLFLDKEKVLPGELATRIRQIRKERRDPILVIRTDRDAPAGVVIMVTEIAKQVGQLKLNFKTKK